MRPRSIHESVAVHPGQDRAVASFGERTARITRFECSTNASARPRTLAAVARNAFDCRTRSRTLRTSTSRGVGGDIHTSTEGSGSCGRSLLTAMTGICCVRAPLFSACNDSLNGPAPSGKSATTASGRRSHAADTTSDGSVTVETQRPSDSNAAAYSATRAYSPTTRMIGGTASKASAAFVFAIMRNRIFRHRDGVGTLANGVSDLSGFWRPAELDVTATLNPTPIVRPS